MRWTLRQIPRAVLGLIAATAAVSIAAAVTARNGSPALVQGLLVVPELLRGQVWRLVTWVLYELGPLALVFACLTLYWFGSELARTWGRRRFLSFYFGLAALAAAVTTVVGRFVWAEVAAIPHGGSWPVLDGMLVAWGRLFADRSLRFWGVPLTGRHLVWVTVGGTVLFALFGGLAPFVPHFAAEAAVLLWFGPLRRALAAREQARRARAASWSFEEWLQRDQHRKRRR
jgi:membrane associated rhomboid family serine protease